MREASKIRASVGSLPRRNLNGLRSYADLVDRGMASLRGESSPFTAFSDTSLQVVSVRSTPGEGRVAFHARFQIRELDPDGDERVLTEHELPIGWIPTVT